MQRDVLLSLHALELCVGFSSRRERVKSLLSLRIFGCKSHFYTQELCVSFLTDLWPMHMFSSVFWGLVQVALTHRPLESFSML